VYYPKRIRFTSSVCSMHKFCKILLAVIVFSCPLRCQLGLSDCCGDSGLESPVWPVDEKEEKCGCICSGATMPDAADFFTQTSAEFEIELTLISSPAALNKPFGIESLYRSTAGVATCARNHGRQLRCLHSSFII
jgi:hypothetical protein